MIILLFMDISLNKIIQNAINAYDEGKLNEAEIYFKKALIIKPDSEEVYFNLATTQRDLNNLKEAKINYKNAIRFKPNFIKAHNSLGVVLRLLEELDDAVLSFKKAIELKQDYAEAYNNLGSTLVALLMFKDAEVCFTKAIELKKDYADAYLNLGKTQKNLGRLEESEINTKKAILLNPKNIVGYNSLSLLLKELGRTVEAKKNCFKALTLNNDDGEAHYILGTIYYAAKHYKKAIEHFTLSNYSESKFFLLKCYFENDEQSNLYNELEYLIKNGENNAIIGSIISQSKIKYGITKLNPFCNDPLKYVLKSDLIKKNYFNKIFYQDIIKILDDPKIKKKTTQGLLNNGVQTAGNIFGQKNFAISEIAKIINLEVDQYRSHFRDSDEGFLKNWPKNYSLIGWLVSMQNGGSIKPHMHERGWISGSIYINVPIKEKLDSGNLVVSVESKVNKIDHDNNLRKSIDVVTGSFCLFPSSLHHYTIPFQAEENRIVLAFDIIPK